MDEAITALDLLLRGEVVNMETEWFTLKDARLQMLPYTQPRVEMAVASLVSPSGATAAGKHGIGMLSFQALGAEAFKSLASNWAMAEETAARHCKTVDRSKWRLVIQVHLADTKEEAIRDCRFGLEAWLGYFKNVAQIPILPEGLSSEDMAETYANMDVAVIGTPDDAIATIQKLLDETGGFGCLMLLAHNWADSQKTAKSYELFQRYVVPHFQRLNVNRKDSMDWVIKVRGELAQQTKVAIEKRFAQHAAETGEGG
jgi:limonene 1,2-monooxygenase